MSLAAKQSSDAKRDEVQYQLQEREVKIMWMVIKIRTSSNVVWRIRQCIRTEGMKSTTNCSHQRIG
jgi:hypothetical protein